MAWERSRDFPAPLFRNKTVAVTRVELTKIADFSDILRGREIVTIGVGADGQVLALVVAPEDKEKPFLRGRGGQSAVRQVEHYLASVLSFQPNFEGEHTLEGVTTAFPHIQSLPNGEILLVAARTYCPVGGAGKSAAVYSPDGGLLRSFVLGDGIIHVQVSNDGSIWVSYFDEGVFGNAPVTAAGLVRFDTTGEVMWKYKAPEEIEYIADCYAMNVAHDATWICYYTEFPVVRIKPDGAMRSWKNEVTGARALVTDDHRVLLFGGYRENRNRCIVQDFGDGKLVHAREIDLTLPDGEIPKRVRAVGRGSILHFFIGTNWYQLDLSALNV
jgi:hypothetical protein